MSAVALRVAAGPGVGLGHAIRCRTLAAHLPHAIFITSGAGARTLCGLGVHPGRIETIVEGEPLAAWLRRVPSVERVVFDTLSAGQAAATESEVAAVASTGRLVTVIDSMPPDEFTGDENTARQPSLVVTPYFGARALRRPPRARQWLAGPGWAVLPTELRWARHQPFPLEPRILVTCGAADPGGLSARAAAILGRGSAPVDVIVGPDFSDESTSALRALGRAHPVLRLHENVADMLPHYLHSTIVVGRPGLVRYEIAALGRTGIYLWESEDYLSYFRNFTEGGIAEIYFSTAPGGSDRFDRRLLELTDPGTLKEVASRNAAAMAAIEGVGAEGVAAEILRTEGWSKQ